MRAPGKETPAGSGRAGVQGESTTPTSLLPHHEGIKQALALAAEGDAIALESRKAAGRLLVELREIAPGPFFLQAIDRIGLDLRTALMLINLYAGGTER